MKTNTSTLRELQKLNPADIIRRLKDHFGFSTDSQVAQWMGVSSQNLYSIKIRGSFPMSRLTDISDRLTDCTLEGLMGLESLESSMEDFCSIPLVAARLSAGTGSLETSKLEISRFAFRRDWIQSKGNPNKMVLMRITGDSMEPMIRHNDLVLIDQGNTDIIPLGVYAVAFDDSIYIKQLRPQPRKSLELHSVNPEYAPIMVDLGEESPDYFRVIGRAVWYCHELM